MFLDCSYIFYVFIISRDSKTKKKWEKELEGWKNEKQEKIGFRQKQKKNAEEIERKIEKKKEDWEDHRKRDKKLKRWTGRRTRKTRVFFFELKNISTFD